MVILPAVYTVNEYIYGKTMSTPVEQEWRTADLVGGHPALDFVNTAGGATKARDVELFPDYASVLRWCAVSGVLSEREIVSLRERAGVNPGEANEAVERLRDFRESLHRCLTAELAGAAWPGKDGALIESVMRSALAQASAANDGQRFYWKASLKQCGLVLILARLAIASEELLRSDDRSRVRCCDRCSWLFIDRGRGRPRRWCSMATCGSRAKSARYYQRHRRNTAAEGL